MVEQVLVASWGLQKKKKKKILQPHHEENLFSVSLLKAKYFIFPGAVFLCDLYKYSEINAREITRDFEFNIWTYPFFIKWIREK